MNVSISNKKTRIVKIDYIKVVLIALIVFGHFLECIETNLSIKLYQFIYIFHIPFFVFISGYLSRFKIKKILKFFIIFLIFQITYFVFSIIFLKVIPYDKIYIRPYWLMWYLFSLICWQLTIPLLEKVNKNFLIKIIFLIYVFLIGCLVGYIKYVNRNFSLSRTIVFYLFFCLGYFYANKKQEFKIKRLNIINSILLIITMLISIYLINIDYFSDESLFRASPYSGSSNTIYGRCLLYLLPLIAIFTIFNLKIGGGTELKL